MPQSEKELRGQLDDDKNKCPALMGLNRTVEEQLMIVSRTRLNAGEQRTNPIYGLFIRPLAPRHSEEELFCCVQQKKSPIN